MFKNIITFRSVTVKILSVFMLFLISGFISVDAQSEDKNQMEDITKIAEQYFNQQKSGNKNIGSPNGTEAIQEKFFTGAATADYFGYSVSSAGDVNGDEYEDIIVGAPLNDAGGADAGRAYIYFGGNVFNSIADLVLTGSSANDQFGSSVSAAGDVNGDGYDDVIVGADLNDSLGADRGCVYIYLGGSPMNSIADGVLRGAAAGDNFGYSVTTAGDVNGDGYSDLIVGARNNDAGGNNAGRAYIYLGGSTFNNVVDLLLTGAAAGDFFGSSVATAKDVNGDGFDDIIVGAFANDAGGNSAGRAYIYFGGSTLDNISDVVLTGAGTGDNFGISVSTAGDVNGDGYSDVIVGAWLNAAAGIDAGRAYIYFGSSTMDNAADVTLTGTDVSDFFGYSVSTAGDINCDGFADVIVGSFWNDDTFTDGGRAYVYFGGINMDFTADVILNSAAAGDQFGWSVSTVGDFNGDGNTDLIVGAYLNDAGGNNSGRVYLYTNALKGGDIPDEFFTGIAAGHRFGYSVSAAGDVNGDGYPDVLVGAPLAGGNSSGRAYIYFGGPNLNNTADVTLIGEAANDNFGSSVSTAGDVNGDGYSDVIVGAPYNDFGGTNAGRAYIYFGGASMDNTQDVSLGGIASGEVFGSSVSTAGDVNGDGYSDVIVGATGNAVGGSNAGRTYIYFGGASMNNTIDVTLTGSKNFEELGRSVSTGGDVNGDGYSDVVVGTASDTAYVYFGETTMNNVADVVLTAAAGVFGYAISNAGDVNGDGYSDLIVGATIAGANVSGRAYIFFGGTSMNGVSDVTLIGETTDDLFGWSVSAAGDVNRDGYADVIVGAPNNDAGGSNAGRAYIYFGGLSMNNDVDITLNGAAAVDYFGSSVSIAGDVNGDGYSDVIVGAYNNDVGGNDAGRTYLYFSSSPPIKPTLFQVKDVPNDQGSKLKIQYARSGYDIKGNNKITSYKILRSYPPGTLGFSWETVSEITAIKVPYYTFTNNTPTDSGSGNVGTFYYRILAQTADPDEYWFSGIMSGRSIDNLSPALVKNFNGFAQGNNNMLTWKPNTESDLKNYYIYRSLTAPVNPDTMTPVIITSDTTGLDITVPPGDMYYFIRARDIHDNFGPLTQIASPLGLKQIAFTALIEGFYDSGSNTMVEDTVTVLLKNTNAPYTTIDQTKVKLNTSGNGFVKFRQALNGTNYYLVVQHRNSIETWSKLGQQFTNSEMIYNFTSASTQAYGDNMKLKETKWCIYSGDLTSSTPGVQDGYIDIWDDFEVYNDSYGNTYRLLTDINYDGFVDIFDDFIVYNNSYNGVTAIYPGFPPALLMKKNTERFDKQDTN